MWCDGCVVTFLLHLNALYETSSTYGHWHNAGKPHSGTMEHKYCT